MTPDMSVDSYTVLQIHVDHLMLIGNLGLLLAGAGIAMAGAAMLVMVWRGRR